MKDLTISAAWCGGITRKRGKNMATKKPVKKVAKPAAKSNKKSACKGKCKK